VQVLARYRAARILARRQGSSRPTETPLTTSPMLPAIVPYDRSCGKARPIEVSTDSRPKEAQNHTRRRVTSAASPHVTEIAGRLWQHCLLHTRMASRAGPKPRQRCERGVLSYRVALMRGRIGCVSDFPDPAPSRKERQALHAQIDALRGAVVLARSLRPAVHLAGWTGGVGQRARCRYSVRPAVAGIVGGRRRRTASMISLGSMLGSPAPRSIRRRGRPPSHPSFSSARAGPPGTTTDRNSTPSRQ